jgi:superfamily I DNA/RNA helicase
MSLPKPIGRQKEVLCLPAQGHFAVLGTAGSGKTTLAILRSAYLTDPKTDHHGKTLLVTFNRALVTYLKHLQDRTLRDVVVENYHTFARGYLNSRGKTSRDGICSDLDQRKNLIASAVRKVADGYEKHPFFDRPAEIFSEEIRWLAQHGISKLDDYEAMERVGRSGARIERKLRKHVFEIRDAYLAKREAIGKKYDWDDLATATREELETDDSPRRYRHVVIDEGQDFSPVGSETGRRGFQDAERRAPVQRSRGRVGGPTQTTEGGRPAGSRHDHVAGRPGDSVRSLSLGEGLGVRCCHPSVPLQGSTARSRKCEHLR